MSTIPFLPESAPFSPEQRGWLNGLLAGLFAVAPGSNAAVPAAPDRHALAIAVLHASQSGTAEGLARKLAKELKIRGYVPAVSALETHTAASLGDLRHAVFIASTYGEGDPPDAVKPFFDQLSSTGTPRLDKLTYTVLALGDSNYEHFCRFGMDLDERLHSLGAARLLERTNLDVDVDVPFAAWQATLLPRIDQLAAVVQTAKPVSAPAPASAAPRHTRDNPHLAPLLTKVPLTAEISSKQTLHLAFCLRGTEMPYEAGDACGVLAQNDPALISDILAATGLTGAEHVTLSSGKGAEHKLRTTLSDALIHSLQITRLTRKLIESYATIGGCTALLKLLVPEQQADLDRYLYDRGLIDLLTECPGVLASAQDVVDLLPRLPPRLYSISSSPAAHADEIHTTVAVVRYRAHNRERGGVCSTLFADRAAPGDRLPLYIQPNKRFRLPSDTAAPMVMIGPGTGVAPFRAFLHERRALGHAGRNWLFFGERCAGTDFLYQDELTAMQRDGHLSRLNLAFSRDQPRKIYVQDRMIEHSAELFRWLEEGASLYVCGDASRMAKDVDAALHTIISTAGRCSPDSAAEYVQQLKDARRYQRDIY